MFQERKFNFMSEFAMITDYAIIAKFLGLIRGDRLLRNRKEINMSVFKFMKRIVDLMKADWLFFQIDFLNVFHEIISNNEIRVISLKLCSHYFFRCLMISESSSTSSARS